MDSLFPNNFHGERIELREKYGLVGFPAEGLGNTTHVCPEGSPPFDAPARLKSPAPSSDTTFVTGKGREAGSRVDRYSRAWST